MKRDVLKRVPPLKVTLSVNDKTMLKSLDSIFLKEVASMDAESTNPVFFTQVFKTHVPSSFTGERLKSDWAAAYRR